MSENYQLELTYTLEVVGTREQVAELRDRIDDAVYDEANVYCGDPECCPVEPAEPYATAGFGTAQIDKLVDEAVEA